jgi:glycosyltransferase involved in cell wall biosynthesis
MRISIITSPFGTLPPSGIGAIEKRWHNMGVAFAGLGHEVVFYCKRSEQEYVSGHGYSFRSFTGYKRTGNLPSDLWLDLLYSFRVLIRLSQCDVVVMNTFFTALLCPLFRRKFKVAVYNVARYPKGQLRWYKGVDRLACVSRAVAKVAIEQSPHVANKIKVVNNPVDTVSFRCPSTGSVSEKNHIGCKDHVIGYSGRIHPEKGLDLLVKAVVWLRKKNYRLRLRLVGPRTVAQGGGGEAYVEELERLAGDLSIEWVDPISNAHQLADEIANFDIFCYPSVAERGESFGVAPLEAMAVGCATVVSALECFQDFIQDGVTGLVFDHRAARPVEALADKIEFLLKHDDVRKKIAIEGSSLAHNRFSTASIAEEYLRDFELLLAQGEKNARIKHSTRDADCK